MYTKFPNAVPQITYGGNVRSDTINKIANELASRTNYLLDQLNEVTAGSALVITNEPCTSEVTAFNAVYWNADDRLFEPALSQIVTTTGGEYVVGPSALAIGITTVKNGVNLCDITIGGRIAMTADQVAILINNETPVSGLLYLSATIPGKLTTSKPLAAIPVGVLLTPSNSCRTTYQVILGAGCLAGDINKTSTHEYRLYAVPAGDHVPPDVGNPHTILNPDSASHGWLPADDAIFNGAAPDGAVFGYNISQDPTLANIWPPSGKQVLVEFYSSSDIGIVGLKEVPTHFYIVDDTTIWWTTDCYSKVPWDYLLNTVDPPDPPEDCAIPAPTEMILRFDRSFLDNATRVVTKLSGTDDKLITFVNAAGQEASRGDLKAKFNADIAITNSAATGSTAIKSVGPGFTFTSGKVVEGVRSLSSTLIVTGTESRLIDPGQAESDSNYRIYQGIVSVESTPSAFGLDISPTLVRLGDSLQRAYNDINYIGFPSGIASSVTCRFDIPNGDPGSKNLVPYVVMFGRAAGPFSAMSAKYYVIKAPPAPGGAQIVTGSTTSTTFNVVTPSTGLDANAVIKVTAGAIPVYGGDTVFVTFSRAADASPSFSADIGFIRIGAAVRAR